VSEVSTNRNDPDIFQRAFAAVLEEQAEPLRAELMRTNPILDIWVQEQRKRWAAMPWWEKARRRGRNAVYDARMKLASAIAGFDVEDRW
jgi:hypothetical protein